MALNPIRAGDGRSSPFVQPFLRALDRMQEREMLHPDQLAAQARTLLDECFGASEEPVETAFAYGATGLASEHTDYFDGFGLLFSLPYGTAVAVRQAEKAPSRILFEDSEKRRVFELEGGAPAEAAASAPAAWACVVERAVQRLRPPERHVEVAVVSTVLPCCGEAYLAALAVAAARALQRRFDTSGEGEVERLQGLFAACVDRPFSMAYGLAAHAGEPRAFTLVDTRTHEHLPVEAPARDVLGWGLVDTRVPPAHDAAYYRQRRERADEALALLRRRGFEGLTSFRELEHRTLGRALDALPRPLRPLVRHLVTENQRVQKLVAAVRRRDWQMFGALLLMSHASQRSDGEGTPAEVDLVVEEVEAMSIEGMYGARRTGRGGCVLVAGQPFVVPAFLDRVKTAFEERFGRAPETMLL